MGVNATIGMRGTMWSNYLDVVMFRGGEFSQTVVVVNLYLIHIFELLNYITICQLLFLDNEVIYSSFV